MGIVRLNLRDFWKNQRMFMMLIILVQMLAAFFLSFVVGVIINNQMFLDIDYYGETILIFPKEEVAYSEIEETLIFIYDDILGSAGKSISVMARSPEGLRLSIDVEIEDGKYRPGTDTRNVIIDQLASGRIFTIEELNGEGRVAIVGNFHEEELIIAGQDCEIIGNRGYNNEFSGAIAIVSPSVIRDLGFEQIVLSFNRYISEEETSQIVDALDSVIPGRYSLVNNGEGDGKSDVKAVLRSSIMSSVLIGFVLIGTLTILYQHIMDKRKYKNAIISLIGASKVKTIGILFAEMMILSVPSIAIGFGLFKCIQEKWLEDIYPYMETYLDGEMYIKLFTGMVILLTVFFITFAVARSMGSIKKQLIEAKI